jgi:hypothetical protein
MHKVNITAMNAIIPKDGKVLKRPLSKYNDKSFIFVTEAFDNLKDAASFMFQNFTLSKPIRAFEPVRIRRTIQSLEPYEFKKIHNIALDLDKITTEDDYLDIIDYFKDKKYSCILGKSMSFNSKDCFNIKGIISFQTYL